MQAVRLIEKNLLTAVSNGENVEARMDMLHASLMGITAFSFALNAIPVHNFAHAYGAMFRIPHGLANAVFLPAVMESIPSLYLPKIYQLAEALNVETGNEEGPEVLNKVINKIKLLQHKAGLPSDFSEYGISERDLEKVIPAVALDPAAVSFPMPPELIQAIGQKVVPIGVK